MGFSMNKPNMNITYGGESNKQQKSNLMKDNPVAKHASAMNMGKKTPMYQQEEETPLEVTAGAKKKIAASGANDAFKKAIAAEKPSPVKMHDDPKKIKTKIAKGKKKAMDKKNTSPVAKYKKH